MNAIQAFVPSEIVKTFAAFLEFYYIARRNIITEDSLEQLKAALHKFHDARKVFSGTARADNPSAFSLPRQHAMVHYYDHIKNFGAPNGLCSSITESKHIDAVKRPWRRSNKHSALIQMLKYNERLDKLATARADFTARGMLKDSCFIQAIMNIPSTMDHDSSDDTASSSDETDSDASNANYMSTRDFSTAIPPYETGAPNDTDTWASNTSDDHPHTPHPPSPTPLDDNEEDEDECGPVESGPLMNEVRLVSRKGTEPLS
jgi:hypothetical protein